jgi:radical SAM-linked protein
MRIRITFSKNGAMRYVGHLDLHRSWERTFRRAGLPLSYSQGFHPQPRLNLACALPVGFTSQCEVLEAWLDETSPLPELQAALQNALPPGLEIHTIEVVENTVPAIQTRVVSAIYMITFLDNIRDLDERLSRIISADHLPRERRGKPYDLRPLIESVNELPQGEDGKSRLQLQISAREGATGRPEEFLAEMGINHEATRVHRQGLIFQS